MSVDIDIKKRSATEEPSDTPATKKSFHGTDDTDQAIHQLTRSWNHQKKYSHDPFGENEVDYIECPDLYDGERATVFLAGGISNCPNWQDVMKDLIRKSCSGLVPLNPRRRTFDITRPEMHDEQIKWEFDALRKASVIIFWFPKDTLCPITLFELGTWSVLHKTQGSDIIVGTDPNYARAADVKTQLSLLTGTDFPVVHSLEDLASSLKQWWDDHKE